MSSPAPEISYQPGIYMPIIPPPPPGKDRVAHYHDVMIGTTLTVVPISSTRLHITISSHPASELFAVTGGLIRFIPAGLPLPLPGNPPSPGAGSLVLQTWAADVAQLRKKLPPGVPPMLQVLYLNVTASTVRAAADARVRQLLPAVLQGAWNQPSTPGSVTELQENYLDRLLLGETSVFVPPGTKIGEADFAAAPSSEHEFTLVFTNRVGAELSSVPHLRGLASYEGERWAGHPLAVALRSIPIPVSIFLQFEVWNKKNHLFEKLPAGVPVDVMDFDPISLNDVLATQNTDAQGQVQFNFANMEELAGEPPDIFFRARTDGIKHAGHTLPEKWSTKGWKAVDGSAGYYENFTGTQLGEATQPLVFRIGLDFHLRLEYKHDPTGRFRPAPEGIPVGIHNGLGIPTLPDVCLTPRIHNRTDKDGEVHDVLFDVSSEHTIYFSVDFEITDGSINLPTARVDMEPRCWYTFVTDADRTPSSYYPNLDRTSIGTQAAPALLRCTFNDRNVALFFLTMVREWNTFFFHITGGAFKKTGAWTGVPGLTIYRDILWPATRSYSWPVETVRIHKADHWERGTLIHELTHQAVWKQANYFTLGIGIEAQIKGIGPGDLELFHASNLLVNPEHALIEGWPAFIQAIFERSTTPPYLPDNPTSPLKSWDSTPGLKLKLGPLPFNRGESVEGAFANGMWSIFSNEVVGSGTNADVPESFNGDITLLTGPWLKDPTVQDRFVSMVWAPLGDVSSMLNPTTTAYIAAIRTRNPATWSALEPWLQAFNMAFP